MRRAGRRHPWLRACLCAAADRSQASKDTRSSSHNVGSHSQPNSHASHTVGTSSHDAHTCSTAQTAPAHAHPITCIQLPANLAALNTLHLTQVDSSALDDSGAPTCSLNTVFNLPAYPSSSSCDSTSSSTASPPDYQNALPFHIQQVNAAQIYSSPPPTPTLSQLYDSADPALTAALHQYIQPRTNALPLSPHLLAQQQAVSALPLNPTVLQAALSSLHSSNPKTLQAVDHHHYHNLLQLPLAAVHLAPDDNNYLQPKSHLTSTTLTSTGLQPATDTGPPPPPLTTYALNAMNTHIPPSTSTVLPIRQSLRDTQPNSPPTPSPSTSTPSTSKSKAPPRKPERPQMNSNNGVKGISFSSPEAFRVARPLQVSVRDSAIISPGTEGASLTDGE